jgi:hypothetical protein
MLGGLCTERLSSTATGIHMKAHARHQMLVIVLGVIFLILIAVAAGR